MKGKIRLPFLIAAIIAGLLLLWMILVILTIILNPTPPEDTMEQVAAVTTESTLVEIDLSTAEFSSHDSIADRNIPQDPGITSTSEPTIATTEASSTTTTTTTDSSTTTTKITTTTEKVTTTRATTVTTTAVVQNLVVTSFPSIVYRNQDVTLYASGQPNTKYTIRVYYSSGASKADGLGEKISDSNGAVSWSWQIGGKTTLGAHYLTISGGGQKIQYDFEVAAS